MGECASQGTSGKACRAGATLYVICAIFLQMPIPCGPQEALLEERQKLEAAVQQELKRKGAAPDLAPGPAASRAAAAGGPSGMEAAAAAADAQEDALDAFMSDVQHQIEDDKVLLPWLTPSLSGYK